MERFRMEFVVPVSIHKGRLIMRSVNAPKDDGKPHAFIRSSNDEEGHGKETGLVHAPIISVNPSSGNVKTFNKEKPEIIDNVDIFGVQDNDDFYPFAKLESGQGFFVPATEHESVDELMLKMHKIIDQWREKFGEVECDEKGDEILETVIVKEKKKNDDGTVQMNGGVPNFAAAHTNRPKMIYARNYLAKAVVKDDKFASWTAPYDGVMIVRVI
jgi:hypothetical protein